MGLIKAAVGAIGSTLHDQWKEAIRCEEMGNDILMMKKTTKNGVISKKYFSMKPQKYQMEVQ